MLNILRYQNVATLYSTEGLQLLYLCKLITYFVGFVMHHHGLKTEAIINNLEVET